MKAAQKQELRGIIEHDVPLGRRSWFGCGGSADRLYRPADQNDLSVFLKNHPEEHLTVLGGLANTIIRDGGIRGLVVMPGKSMATIKVEGTDIYAGSGTLNGTIASQAAKNGIGGLEFLSGIPGTLGGALRMNAGAYGREVKDVLVEAYALDRAGESHIFKPVDLEMSYRSTALPDGMIFTGALLHGTEQDESEVRDNLKAIKQHRRETQPIEEKTGGSTFRNPTPEELQAAGLPEDMRAWQIVDKVGGRDIKIGGAMMSPRHGNFMINTGTASASDLEDLGDEIIKRARDQLGLMLHWEIKRIGERV